ncbi:hypothetical protein [Bradyrhizobium sp. USDA 4350]
MTEAEAQAILNEAEDLHAQNWRVDDSRVGSIYQAGLGRTVSPEVWLAMRAILIGRGFAVQARGKQ